MPSLDYPREINALLLREKQARRRLWISRVTWAYVVVLLVYWAVLIWWGDSWWPGTLLLYGPRWPLALPLLILTPLVWRWARRALLPCLIALFMLLFPITGMNIPVAAWMATLPAESAKVRVVSFNANMGKHRMPAWNEFLKQTQPDIVVCQEWPIGFARPDEWKSGWHVQEHLGNLLVASRWPIARTELLRENELHIRGYVGWYDLNSPLGPISLANVHLPTPRGEGELEDALRGKWRRFSELDLLSDRRLHASRYVREWLGKYPSPMLIVGDMNLTSDSSIYSQVWNRYDDAFSQAGWGWGYTKWTHWYGLRIDHILFEKSWACTRCWVGPQLGSDHLPLVADLVFTGGQ